VDQAKQLGRAGWHRALEQVDQRKGMLAHTLDGFASQLEGLVNNQGDPVSQVPAELAGRAASYIRQFSHRIEQGTTEELITDVENQFRARPGAFMAGLVAIGFLAGRMLRR